MTSLREVSRLEILGETFSRCVDDFLLQAERQLLEHHLVEIVEEVNISAGVEKQVFSQGTLLEYFVSATSLGGEESSSRLLEVDDRAFFRPGQDQVAVHDPPEAVDETRHFAATLAIRQLGHLQTHHVSSPRHAVLIRDRVNVVASDSDKRRRRPSQALNGFSIDTKSTTYTTSVSAT